MIGIIVCTTECNLMCKYCYEHLDPCRKRQTRIQINKNFHARLNDVKKFISDVKNAADRSNRPVQFIFHGGEPLLLNTDLLKKVFDYIAKTTDASIYVQTNGTLASSDFSRLCKQFGVGVTISIDGPIHLHDQYRVDAGNHGTLNRILSAVDLFRKDGIPVGALATITNEACEEANEVFAFFNELKMDFSVNRCFPVQGRDTLCGAADESEYRNFLSNLYDIYFQAVNQNIHIPCFDRCIHDLKEENGAYIYYPGSSPELIVYQCDTGTVFRPLRILSSKKYTGTRKKCVLDHLCWQQKLDYYNAIELNTKMLEKG